MLGFKVFEKRTKFFMRSFGKDVRARSRRGEGASGVTDAMRDTSYMYLHRSSRGRSVRRRRFGRHLMWALPFDCAWIPCRDSPPKEARLSAAIRWLDVVDISGEFQFRDLEAGLGSVINIPRPHPSIHRRPLVRTVQVPVGCRQFPPPALQDQLTGPRPMMVVSISLWALGGCNGLAGWLQSGRSNSC